MAADRTEDAHRGPGHPIDHGLHSKRMKPKIAERGREIADHLLRAGHLDPALDEIACLEVGRLCAVIEACDASIESRGVVTGSGADPQHRLDAPQRFSGVGELARAARADAEGTRRSGCRAPQREPADPR